MTPERARELLDGSRRKRVLLIGDLMMDEWVMGRVKRISPEAPIPVVTMPLDKEARTHKPGGAGNVAAILLSLGAQVQVVGVVGEDGLGERLLSDLEASGADVSRVLRDPSRPTSHKMRILAERQQLVRVDTESTEVMAHELAVQLRDTVRAGLRKADVALVADYAKGVLSATSFPREVAAQARQDGVPLCADPKPKNIDLFRGAWLVSPNEAEALQAAGTGNAQAEEARGSYPPELSPALLRAGEALRERLEAEALFVTMGDRGIAVFPPDGSIALVPPQQSASPPAAAGPGATAVGDGTGCGDAASAASALALAAGGSFQEAAELANAAGGVVSRFVGVYSPTPAEVLAAFGSGAATGADRRRS